MAEAKDDQLCAHDTRMGSYYLQGGSKIYPLEKITHNNVLFYTVIEDCFSHLRRCCFSGVFLVHPVQASDVIALRCHSSVLRISLCDLLA